MLRRESETAFEAMVRWRGMLWLPLVGLLASLLLAPPLDALLRGLGVALVVLAAVFGLVVLFLLLPTWLLLFQAARETGGSGYALMHLCCAVVLGPFGVLVVPKLIASDRRSGFADWRRNRPLPRAVFALRWSLAFLGAVVGTALSGFTGTLLGLLAGILVAYVLTPLVWRPGVTPEE